jgi:MYXO-CTERM domain-containing protein
MSRMMSVVRVAPFLFLFCALPGWAEAQTARYYGAAFGAIIEDGESEPVIAANVGAGGGGAEDPDALCDVSQTECFDVSAAGAGDLEALIALSAVRTVGGAFTDAASETPNPGFPRVESSASVVFVGIPDAVEIVVGESRAIADAETGELSAEITGIVVRLGGPEGVEIPIPAGDTFEIPGFGTLLAGRQMVTEDDGLKIITVDGALLDSPELGQVVLGRSVAGLELATTSGGSFGGGGGCAAAPNKRAADGFLILGALVLLVGMRRRSHRQH